MVTAAGGLKARSARWPARIALGAGVLVMITGVRTLLFIIGAPVQFDRMQLLLRTSVELGVWLLLLCPVLWLSARKRIGPRGWAIAIALHVAFAVAFLLLHSVLSAVLVREILPRIDARLNVVIYGRSQVNFLTYWALVIADHALDYALRYRARGLRTAQLELQHAQLETQLARAQLQALQTQLQPHFLFNTLNTVSSFIHADPDRAERMLARLGDLLRGVLESGNMPQHTLQDELAFIDNYLAIQQERFGERLRITRDVATDAAAALVPTLLLQPVVENAVQHGVSRRLAGGHVEIRAARRDHQLEIVVRDHGTPRPPRESTGFGLGLSTTQARLTQLYGTAYTLDIRGDEESYAVTVRIPWQTTA
jgi:sensor histidine kinase YesM